MPITNKPRRNSNFGAGVHRGGNAESNKKIRALGFKTLGGVRFENLLKNSEM